ncbi:peptide-methionine (R)-S-oxide reductase MsrB [Marispirochaeta sp.]|jgi:peptide-methionine (R)-S-oxide reductase|uniref:peptide-methionine (R)-S-oxide reductase MsrB n=1 Tax=Marispirochaeta sp. TaxID=2038653 RepID=UPI0029C5FFC4|nr:peptide-methionine (R)-S-oxide reductase MsrB [Marispirochaeta sp.]
MRRYTIALVLLLVLPGFFSAAESQTRRLKGYPVQTDKEELDFQVQLSEQEWRERLTDDQYYILCEEGTEYAFSGKYDKFYEKGTYYSAATGQPLFSSETKFDSGSGWPSFYAPIDADAVTLIEDNSLFMRRIEVVDSLSGAHLGHVFTDGPDPTGLRFCINSDALIFVPEGGEPPEIMEH